MASDTVIPSFWREQKITNVINTIPAEEIEAFNTIGYTIGGMMLFPGIRIDNKMTINQAGGVTPESRTALTIPWNVYADIIVVMIIR